MAEDYRSVDKFDNLDIKIQLGSYVLNVVYLRRISKKYALPIPRHSHCDFELHFQKKGNGNVNTDFGCFDTSPGTIYITGPNTFHSQYFNENEIMEEYGIGFEFVKHKDERTNFFFTDDADHTIEFLQEHSFLIGEDDLILDTYFDTLFSELKNPKEGSYEIAKSLISLIIIYSIRLTFDDVENIKLPEKNLDEQRKFIIETYFLSIKPNMSPEDLAAKLCISVRQLNRVIKQYYNKSFKDKLFESKFESSLTYLSDKSYKISDIAELLCFPNEFQFSNQFKKYFGITPSEYRKNKLP